MTVPNVDVHRKKVIELLTPPKLKVSSPSILGKRTREQRLQWAMSLETAVEVLSEYLEAIPADGLWLDKARKDINDFEVFEDLDDVPDDNDMIDIQSLIEAGYEEAARSAAELIKRAEMMATARAVGVVPHLGKDVTTVAGVDYASASVEDRDALTIAGLTRAWLLQCSRVYDLENDRDLLVENVNRSITDDLPSRIRWREVHEGLAQVETDIQRLHKVLDEKTLRDVEDELLAVHDKVVQLSTPQIETETSAAPQVSGRQPLRHSLRIGLMGLVPGAVLAVPVAVSGAGALLTTSLVAAFGITAAGLNLLTTRSAAGQSPAAIPTAAEPEWNKKIATSLAAQRAAWGSRLPEEQLAMVDTLLEQINPLLGGTHQHLSPLDQSGLQRLAAEMLPTVVNDFLGLQLGSKAKREESETNFAEMMALLSADARRLTEAADTASLQKQQAYQAYVKDVLGHSELNLRKD